MNKTGKQALFALAFCALVFSGCASFIAKKSLRTVTGPSGTIVEVRPLMGMKSLSRYSRIDVADFTTNVPSIVSSSITQAATMDCVNSLRLATVDKQQGEETVKVPIFTSVRRVASVGAGGRSGTLAIKGNIVYYDLGSRQKRIADIGGYAHLVARVQLVDEQSGKLLADIFVRGVVRGSFSGGSASDATKGVAKALTKYIVEHH